MVLKRYLSSQPCLKLSTKGINRLCFKKSWYACVIAQWQKHILSLLTFDPYLFIHLFVYLFIYMSEMHLADGLCAAQLDILKHHHHQHFSTCGLWCSCDCVSGPRCIGSAVNCCLLNQRLPLVGVIRDQSWPQMAHFAVRDGLIFCRRKTRCKIFLSSLCTR